MGDKYPNNAFTIIVFKDNVSKFSYQLETLEGKEVCVSGMIKDFKGKPDIVVDSEKQIVVKKEKRE